MKVGFKLTGRVSRVSTTEAAKDKPARTYVVIAYEGGNLNVVNASKVLPVVDQRIDADIECELQSLVHFGNIQTVAFPRQLVGFVVSKEQAVKF